MSTSPHTPEAPFTVQPAPPKRCQYIHAAGTQCGSPALRNERFCYYHKDNRPKPIEYSAAGELPAIGDFMLPVFEDAHSIQAALRHVMQLLLQRRIDPKTAGLLFYAMQIASTNLKRMEEEKPKPRNVVVDVDKVADTPINLHSKQPPPQNWIEANYKPSEEEVQRQLEIMRQLGPCLGKPEGVSATLEDLALAKRHIDHAYWHETLMDKIMYCGDQLDLEEEQERQGIYKDPDDEEDCDEDDFEGATAYDYDSILRDINEAGDDPRPDDPSLDYKPKRDVN